MLSQPIAVMLEFVPPLLWLLITSFSLGFALTREKSIITFGYGLAAFAVLCPVLSFLHLLNWLFLLGLSLALLAYFAWRGEPGLSVPKPDAALLLVLLMAAVNFAAYYAGATAYPWLEDDDSWLHAVGAKWVAMTGSYARHFDGTNFYRLYIEPYPPAYDCLMGVLHQMAPSVSGTLKLFNSLLVAWALVAAFFAVESLTRDRRLALFASFFLFAMPAFMSHFIWAQTLAMLLAFVSLHAYPRALEDRRFVLPAAVAAASVALTQPSAAAIFALLSLVYAAAKLRESGAEAAKRLAAVAAVALALAAIYYLPVLLKYGPMDTAIGIGFYGPSYNNTERSVLATLFTPGTTEDSSEGRLYGPADYVLTSPLGRQDQQTGFGPAVALLALAGAVLATAAAIGGKRDAWLACALLWLAIGILGTEGDALPLKLFPHRFWVFLAIPVAMLSAYALVRLDERLKSLPRFLLPGAVALLVLLTSAADKAAVQTALWPPGLLYASEAEFMGYLGLKSSLPANTPVFPLCSVDAKVIGNDLLSEPYVPEYELFRRSAMNLSGADVHAFLKPRGYAYLVVDSTCMNLLGEPRTLALLGDYAASGRYEPAFSNSGFILLKLK